MGAPGSRPDIGFHQPVLPCSRLKPTSKSERRSGRIAQVVICVMARTDHFKGGRKSRPAG
jgi:hypothetical protein